MAKQDPACSCCCSGTTDGSQEAANTPDTGVHEQPPWITGMSTTPTGEVPQVATRLTSADRLGGWKARWAIGRMRYAVEPGLYAIGKPSDDSQVFVSANYKMSFDRLRSSLDGLNAWILVLDTKAVNVWCAAGKGTFGTDELIRQIYSADLPRIVSHRRLIVPQLGAPGIAAHEVKKRSGFRVTYGPVRAEDIPKFLDAGMKATPEMRHVRFPLADRLAVVPVELVMSAKYVVAIMVALLLLAGLGSDGYSWSRVAGTGLGSAALFAGAFAVAAVLVPALLPWLPGRALAFKGLFVGLAFLTAVAGWLWVSGIQPNWLTAGAWCLLIPMTTSIAAMNFTGATTYTSLSGVRREMRLAVPIQATAGVIGTILWIVGRFV